MNRQLGPASRSINISSAAKAGLVVVAIMVAASSGCNELSRSDIRSETADALQTQDDDMRSLREVDPKLINYEQIDVIETGFERATGILLEPGSEPSLWVVGDQAVRVFDSDGFCGFQRELSGAPTCLAAGEDLNIYVGFRDHVQVYGYAHFDLLARWESLGPDAYITSLTAHADDLFVADAGGRVVLRYNKSGELLGKIGQKDESKGIPGLVVPSPHLDVAVSKDGMVLVTNPGRRRVEIYNKDGELQSHWGKASQEIDGFCGCCNPTDIAVLPDGRVVTAEKGLPRVKVYSSDGKFECVVATPDDFSAKAVGLDLAVSDDGRVFVLDPAAGTVKIFARKQ